MKMARPAHFTDMAALIAGRVKPHGLKLQRVSCDDQRVVLERNGLTHDLRAFDIIDWQHKDETQRTAFVDQLMANTRRLLDRQAELPRTFAEIVPRLRPMLLPAILASIDAGLPLDGTPYRFDAIAVRDDGHGVPLSAQLLERWGVTRQRALRLASEQLRASRLKVEKHANVARRRWVVADPHAAGVMLDLEHWMAVPPNGLIVLPFANQAVVLHEVHPAHLQEFFDLYAVQEPIDENLPPKQPIWYWPDGTRESPAGQVQMLGSKVWLPGERGMALITGRSHDPGRAAP